MHTPSYRGVSVLSMKSSVPSLVSRRLARLDPFSQIGILTRQVAHGRVLRDRRVMMTIHLVVLNFNGRELLAECLPSLVRAAAMSRHDCEVIVVDNGSLDDSLQLLRSTFAEGRIVDRPHRGRC